jgi:hypothetical protein
MKKNIRRIVGTLLVLLGLVSVVSACSGGSTSTDGKSSVVGTWKADGFEAEITASEITINIVGNDSKSLYWKGSFHDNTGTVRSNGDTDAMAGSMLGSQDSTKTFSVDDDQIAFEMSLMGTTKTIKLKRA